MEYSEYNLITLLDNSDVDTFTENHLVAIIYNMLCSLNFLHSAGIMHRDIKPANILVDNKCVIKICDFGMSRTIPEKANFPMSEM